MKTFSFFTVFSILIICSISLIGSPDVWAQTDCPTCRTVTCKDQFGTVVADSFCTQPKPITETTIQNGSAPWCPAIVNHGVCGTLDGTRTPNTPPTPTAAQYCQNGLFIPLNLGWITRSRQCAGDGWGDIVSCSTTWWGICKGQYSEGGWCSGPNFGTISACIKSYYIPGHSGIGAYKVEVVSATSCRLASLNTFDNWETIGDYSEINCRGKDQTQCNNNTHCTWTYNSHTPVIINGMASPGIFTKGCLPKIAVIYDGTGGFVNIFGRKSTSVNAPMPYNGPGYYPNFHSWYNIPNSYSCSSYQDESSCNSNTPDNCNWTPPQTVSCESQKNELSCIFANAACTWNP